MKKVIAALMLVIAFVSCSWAWNVGSGTEDDPYVIKDASDFSYFRYMVNDGRDDEGCYYLLSNDIQLTRQVRVAPVGVEEHPFTGHFDGNGHIIYIKIMPLKDDDPNLISYDRALFGYVEASGNDYAIKNLNVAGYAGGYLAAGIASRLMSGDIQECTFTGDVSASGTDSAAGGKRGTSHTFGRNCRKHARRKDNKLRFQWQCYHKRR